MVKSLLAELDLRTDYLKQETVDTVYFGGGTPSLLSESEINALLDRVRKNFILSDDAEITLETNPDDIDANSLRAWKKAGINRLSIGVQSFFDEDLQWMNRAHGAEEARRSIELAQAEGFSNITIDLIYGTPLLTDEKWKENVMTAISYGVSHLSCYALTVESKTPLQKMIRERKREDVDPDKQSTQFLLLMHWLEEAGYEHYEISNFAKPGFRSRHNSAYWQGKPYLGIGPSAHSFDGRSRQWNVANNSRYISSINKKELPTEYELLTPEQQINEYIMTSLRTSEGLDLARVNEQSRNRLLHAGKKYLDGGLMFKENDHLILTREGRLMADGIAADLFED